MITLTQSQKKAKIKTLDYSKLYSKILAQNHAVDEQI